MASLAMASNLFFAVSIGYSLAKSCSTLLR